MSDLGDFDPDRSEPADFGGGESTGRQDLLNGESDEPTHPEDSPAAKGEDLPDSETMTKHEKTVQEQEAYLEELESDEPTEPRKLEEVMTENTETRHTLSESADKITLKADVKRGNDTRDQDKINVKVKGDNPEATAKKLADTLAALESEGVADTLRQTQPGDDE